METTMKLPFPANNKKLHYSKYRKNYEHFILESIDSEACKEFGFDDSTEGRINYLRTRFNSEVGINVHRPWQSVHYKRKYGEGQAAAQLEALTYWLGGLALDIPFRNEEILELAITCGSVPPVMTEKQELNVIAGYFRFMAIQIQRLINKA